jgi:uncharacterized protein (DUF1697 family)
MRTFLALLRAVNLGPHNQVAMPALREFLLQLGLADPRTVLQSGNAVFRSARGTSDGLERLLETEAAGRLGLRTDVMVRSAEEWGEIIARNPFRDEAERDPSHLVVMCLKSAPRKECLERLQAAITGPERVRLEGKNAYIVYPAGIGRSRLTNALLERHLGTRGTGRNWNTVLRLEALAGA